MSEIVIRAATDADIDGIVALVGDRIGEEDAPEARLVLDDAGFDRGRWSVAVDGDRVVSTMATFPMTMRFGIAEVPASQIEFVATDAAYEGRGLVRRQFAYHDDDLNRRGEQFQLIVGITYFYRRLGYEYALRVSDWRTVAPDRLPPSPEGWVVRDAAADDIDLLTELQTPVRNAAGISIHFAVPLARYVVRSPVYQTVIASRGGAPEATGRLYVYGDEAYVMDLAATDRAGVSAVLAEMGRRLPGRPLSILERPGIVSHVAHLGDSEPSGDAYYARIADPVKFLNAVRPELSRRLAASDLADTAGTGLLSLYSSSVHFSYADGELSDFARGGVEQAPISKGGSGVAPDQFVSLLVGHRGFSGLDALHVDVNVGRQRALMDVLFPPQTSDVQSWVIP